MDIITAEIEIRGIQHHFIVVCHENDTPEKYLELMIRKVLGVPKEIKVPSLDYFLSLFEKLLS